MKIPFVQLQRTDRVQLKGLYLDVTQIESFSVGETGDKTIITMRSGDTWEVHDDIAEIMEACFDILRSISKETSNASLP